MVIAAIILWNTVYMEQAIEALRARGDTITDDLLGYLAPLAWQHINLTGDYVWAPDREPISSSSGFRQLRLNIDSRAA